VTLDSGLLRASLPLCFAERVLKIDLFEGRHYQAGHNAGQCERFGALAAQPLGLKLVTFNCRIFPDLFSVARKRKEYQCLNTYGRAGD
jgi:hypothetical protein